MKFVGQKNKNIQSFFYNCQVIEVIAFNCNFAIAEEDDNTILLNRIGMANYQRVKKNIYI